MRNAAARNKKIGQRHCYAVALGLFALPLLVQISFAKPDAESQSRPAASRVVDFKKDIEPLFRDRCYSCHGPEKQESGFRLDDPAAALKGGDLGLAITPGDSAASPIVEYVSGTSDYITMPPEDSQVARLTSKEVALIRDWIDQGAKRPAGPSAARSTEQKPPDEHWAFKRPQSPIVPQVEPSDWPRNPIDAFVLERLAKAELAPASEADRRTLVRRLSLDLVGLPPTLDEVDRFAHDSSPDAYEKLVERLLESPHYGERWALWWLDLARYADTNGYEIDRPRSIWPYRDWVISAFNANMPFDQFAIEQLAGDLLPDATLSQRIATGFHRNTFTNEEGGHNWEQFRWESIVDRVHTTSTIFLGLTMACAQCHDHKFDPISQREYFQFFAFLNNDDEPHVEVPRPEIVEKRNEILAEIARRESRLKSKFPPGDDGTPSHENFERQFESWRREAASSARAWTILEPVSATSQNNATLTPLDDHSLLAIGDNPEVDTYEVAYRTPEAQITGLKLEALTHPSLPLHGPGRGYFKDDGTFVLSEISVAVRDALEGEVKTRRVELVNPTASFAGKSIARAIDGEKLTGWHIVRGAGRPHCAVFEFTEPVSMKRDGELAVKLLQNYAHQQTLGRFRLWFTSDAAPLQATNMPNEVEQLLCLPPKQWSAEEAKVVKTYYLSIVPELEKEHKKIAKLRDQLPALPTTLILEQRSELRPTHQHIRGEFSRPGPEISADVPHFLHPFPKDAPRNRLTMARWLVDKDNPLVARVIMNQIWQCYFGRGLVNTPEDFGTQGAKPSHPELLDWLACKLMDEAWDLKQMHRLIVNSSTYRQAAIADAKKLQVDPENVLLSRGPRFRLPAETVRDIALRASGLLNPTIGGPSVFPSQPDGAYAGVFGKAKWTTSSGADLYRRGLYTHRKRSAPFAAFAAFDAPPYRTCAMNRVRSNTPLQALAQLNDDVLIEASQSLAKRITSDASMDDARLTEAFQICLTRQPTAEEHRALLDYLQVQRQRLHAGEIDAATIAGLSAREAKKRDGVANLAAWTLVARVLLNLDETITKE